MTRPYLPESDWLDNLLDYTDDREEDDDEQKKYLYKRGYFKSTGGS